MELFGRLGDFWISFGWLIILGTVSMAFIGIFKRAIMKSNTLSVLQYLILWYAMTTALFGAVYIALWGFTLPQLLPGFFRTVLAGAFVNVGIQFANAKAASLDAGEVSLTAPLQAMTPGLITLLALTLGEFPSALGVTGIIIMASGSWILMFPPGNIRISRPDPRTQISLATQCHGQRAGKRSTIRQLGKGARCPPCAPFSVARDLRTSHGWPLYPKRHNPPRTYARRTNLHGNLHRLLCGLVHPQARCDSGTKSQSSSLLHRLSRHHPLPSRKYRVDSPYSSR